MQHDVVVLGELGQAVTHRPALLARFLHRAADIGRRELDAVSAGDLLHLLAAPPHIADRLQLRMDELQADIGAPHRNAGLQDTVHHLLDESRRRGHEAALARQPVGDRCQAVAGGDPGVQEPTTAATSSDEVRKTLLVESGAKTSPTSGSRC